MEARRIIDLPFILETFKDLDKPILEKIISVYAEDYEWAIKEFDRLHDEIVVISPEAASVWIDFKNALKKDVAKGKAAVTNPMRRMVKKMKKKKAKRKDYPTKLKVVIFKTKHSEFRKMKAKARRETKGNLSLLIRQLFKKAS